MNPYNRNKTASYKACMIGLIGIVLTVLYLALTGCAYQQYHAKNFKGYYPDNVKTSMKAYYKQK